MTLDQKLTLLEGMAQVANSADQYQAGYLPGIPSLGIPSLTLSDGPPGVATKQNSTGMTATMGVAATFSQQDAKQNGIVIGRDAKALGQDVVLEPFINIDRDPTWGRAFNTFGEDPLLTGQTGAAEIDGIQSQGTMAMAKHFIAYDGANNVVVDQQTLEEIYLEPFTDAVKAGVSSIMCSYNQINGYPSCGNSEDLTAILRNQLGFKGFVTSDWGANVSTADLAAGDDMEMPGGGGPSGVSLPTFYGKSQLLTAIQNGTVQESVVTQAAGRILYEYDKFGLLTGASKHNVTPEPVAADEKVVLKTGEDAATLLKNDGHALPLSSAALSSLALIGPGAGQTVATGGADASTEKAEGYANLQTGTYQVLQRDEKSNPNAHLSYAVGDDMTGTPVPASNLSYNGGPGVLETNTATSATSVVPQINFTTSNGNALAAGSDVSFTTSLTVASSGSYWLAIQSLGATANLLVDGKSVADSGAGFSSAPRYGAVHPDDSGLLPTTDGLNNARVQINLTAGPHAIQVVATADGSGNPVQVRLNWVTPEQQTANTNAAIAAAKAAQTAVVFAWDTGSIDSALPENQDALIESIAAVNPNTIVVLNNSDPVPMPWLSQVKAVLDMWYPGDAGGTATANVLLGAVDPAGRLPFTWPASLDQGPANQPTTHPERTSNGIDGTGKLCGPGFGGPPSLHRGPACVTTYSEGIYVGYRYYDQQNETPLFPFGYGLSYTSFSYSGLAVTPQSNGDLSVSFDITNNGAVAGDEVPQIYLGAPTAAPTGVAFAAKALAAYGRVSVPAHGSVGVTLTVPARQLQYWSTTGGWTTATGPRSVMVGTNERSIDLSTQVNITA